MKNLKRAVALVSLAAIVCVNSAFADLTLSPTSATGLALSGTGDVSGWLSVSGSLSVWVSASVLPLLTMELSKSTLDFGNLTPWADNVQSLDVTTATNAKDWVVVSVDSIWLATWNSSTDKFIWNLARGSASATTWTDTYTISSTTWNGGTALIESNVASTQTVLTTNNVAKSNTTTNVNLKAVIDAQTEAWNYNDTLTFTVTWNF